ncbi:hypothetical protein [Aquisphaera insulae]|uniref:hypothetical protein n=1 Tax=Aquisphaera insulae TaxID=2712864 RepID=UPI0013EE23E8|nr:hypothetical protein [Aquisphaera insulae]
MTRSRNVQAASADFGGSPSSRQESDSTRNASDPRAFSLAEAKYASQPAMPFGSSALQARKTALIRGSIVVSQESPPRNRTNWCRSTRPISPPSRIQSRSVRQWPRSVSRPASVVSSSAMIAAACSLGSSTQPVHARSFFVRTSTRSRLGSFVAGDRFRGPFGFAATPARKADSAFSACSIFQESSAAFASNSRS